VCGTFDELLDHARTLFTESPAIMLEEFLAGEEATVTVMPPTTADSDKKDYWALPVVTRFNHVDGVAPYSGVVAVASNSRAVTERDMCDPAYAQVMDECERAARLLRIAAPIRIDVRPSLGLRCLTLT
jgi:phosphoribosylamine-glycine ligase